MNPVQDNSTPLISDTASQWAVRMNAPDLAHDEKVAFAAWLRASPIHIREYLNAEALRVAIRDSVLGDPTQIAELLDQSPSNVLVLDTAVRDSGAKARRRPRASRFRAVAAIMVFGIGAVLALYISQVLPRSGYSTEVGEIRRIPLPDGSTVDLNTDSSIRVDFKDDRREIHLARGEAFFVVAKDAQRPFRVLSDTAVVRAIGTQFSVYRKPGGTIVTVLEGRVAAQDEDKTVELTAGHQAVIDAAPGEQKASGSVMPVDAKRATAWRQHRLIFDNQPLSDVVAEFNRYNRQQLLIADPELAAQGISGVFDPDKPEGLLLFLARKGSVQTTEGADDALLLSIRSDGTKTGTPAKIFHSDGG